MLTVEHYNVALSRCNDDDGLIEELLAAMDAAGIAKTIATVRRSI